MRAVVILVVGVLSGTGVVRADSDVLEFTLEQVEQGEEVEQVEQVDPGSPAEAMEHALEGVRWGMSQRDVLDVFKERLRAEYDPRIRAARDSVQQDAIMQEAREAYRRVKDQFVRFEGKVTGWDVSPVAGEFRHGTRESMLVVKRGEGRDLFFFINDRLWKYYRELPMGDLRGVEFDDMAAGLEARFGRGKRVEESRGEGEPAPPGVRWKHEDTRLTAILRGAQYCLVFEHARTLDNLATLRRDAIPIRKKRPGTIDAILMDDSERADFHDAQNRTLTQRARKHMR